MGRGLSLHLTILLFLMEACKKIIITYFNDSKKYIKKSITGEINELHYNNFMSSHFLFSLVNNLESFLDMTTPKNEYGEIFSLMELVRRFYKPRQLS